VIADLTARRPERPPSAELVQRLARRVPRHFRPGGHVPNQRAVPVNDTLPVELNVVSQSPHVVVYRLWIRRPGGAWEVLKDGTTADTIPDHSVHGPLAKGTGLAYWLGLGGNPRTRFEALVNLAQGGQTLPNGACIEVGNTDDSGVAEAHGEVLLV
jgi:hypothetical protein